MSKLQLGTDMQAVDWLQRSIELIRPLARVRHDPTALRRDCLDGAEAWLRLVGVPEE